MPSQFQLLTFCFFYLAQLEGVNEPVVLQVFVGNDAGRVKPHGFYQACRVTGRNTTACQEVDIDGTTVIEVALDPSTNMTLAYVPTIVGDFAGQTLLLLFGRDVTQKHLCCPCAAWTASASSSCAMPTSRLASEWPDLRRKARALGWFSASTSLVQMARCSLYRPRRLPSCAVSHSPFDNTLFFIRVFCHVCIESLCTTCSVKVWQMVSLFY